MKKLISLFLACLLLFSFSACGKESSPEYPAEDYLANYLSDSSVLIISEDADIDEKEIKTHYKDGGILLVKNWELASKVQSFIATTMTTEFSSKDRAIIFYTDANGVPGVSIVGGNSSNLDMEIDEMIAEAKMLQ